MPAVIELENLHVQLGGRSILKGLTASLTGRAIGLLGPNGAGKSTLISTLLGFYKPSAGHARIFGTDIRGNTRELRRLIGYMPENDSFIADSTAVGFVRLMAELSGLPPGEAIERAHEAFYYVGLGEARYRKLGTYSLGMKQMAKLAQAIAHGPKLLFLDEPTNGLDPAARVRMLKLIREIRDTRDVHLIISSHLLRDVEECCEEVLILKEGSVAASCNIQDEREAKGNTIELETAESGEPFDAAIEQLGCEYTALGAGRYRLLLHDGIKVKDLFQMAAARGLQIRKVSRRQDSLEDIFLKAMEGAARGSLQAKLSNV